MSSVTCSIVQQLASAHAKAHLADMKLRDTLEEKVTQGAGTVERGYAVWKRAKIERGLAQAQDRSQMIPAEQILRDLGVER